MKIRLDVLIVNKGLARSREKAKALIKAGNVSVDGKIIKTPSEGFYEDAYITVLCADEYVSRSAYKLKAAIDEFNIDLKDRICLDIGASTGGFTQVMLNAGAGKVYAVDVGHNQLDDTLKYDGRVISMEGINFRSMEKSAISDSIDFAAADLSFISLKLILKKAYDMLNENGRMVSLIKPQFEAGRGNVGKHGIVRDEKLHEKIINDINKFSEELGFYVRGCIKSPIKGGDGNQEYLVYITKQPD